MNEFPQAVRAHFGQRIADFDRPAQPLYGLGGIGAFDAIEAALRCARNQLVKISHYILLSKSDIHSTFVARRFVFRVHVTSFTLRCDIRLLETMKWRAQKGYLVLPLTEARSKFVKNVNRRVRCRL
ncbi:hypothetical protein D9M70_519640 [compost metagenome]